MSVADWLDRSHILKIRIDDCNATQYGALTIPADLVHDAAGNRAANDAVLDFTMSGGGASLSAVEFNPQITLTPVHAETKTLPLSFRLESDGGMYTYAASCYEMNSADCVLR